MYAGPRSLHTLTVRAEDQRQTTEVVIVNRGTVIERIKSLKAKMGTDMLRMALDGRRSKVSHHRHHMRMTNAFGAKNITKTTETRELTLCMSAMCNKRECVGGCLFFDLTEL